MDTYHFLFKFILLGDLKVGKSCVLLNYTNKQFREEHELTIGVEFGSKVITINEKHIKLQIWDTAGAESFRSITRAYYKGAIAVVLIFDLTQRDTFKNILKWHQEVLAGSHQYQECALVGNKLDLEEQRQVTTEEAQEFAKNHKMTYFETSSKTGQNIEQVFKCIAQRIVERIDNKEIDCTKEGLGIKIGEGVLNQNESQKEQTI